MKRFAIMLMALFLAMPVGYTANITSKQTADVVYIHINAYHSTDERYNVCDIELQYDVEKLRFNQDKSTLGCAAYRDADGKIRLIDFGADKPLGKSVYVLAFDVIGKGKTEVKLNKAAFSTKEKSATQDIEPIINKPESIKLWLR